MVDLDDRGMPSDAARPWGVRTALTLDVDWAPDHAIEHVAELLIERGVAATWFLTHMSPAIERLRRWPGLFELGIHPNFLPGSTHGSTPEAVLAHCTALVPEAQSMRSHGLVQSSRLLSLVRASTAIGIDASLFLPRARHLQVIDYPLESGMLRRVPYLWEDDAEMYRPLPDWGVASIAARACGLAVFCFHPIHVLLNSADMAAYRRLGVAGTAAQARQLRHHGDGAGSAFIALLDALAGERAAKISELALGPAGAGFGVGTRSTAAAA